MEGKERFLYRDIHGDVDMNVNMDKDKDMDKRMVLIQVYSRNARTHFHL